jgi:hypothetical protein
LICNRDAGSRQKAPVAEGGPVGRRGEPTGLVPRGSGDKDGYQHPQNHTKKEAIRPDLEIDRANGVPYNEVASQKLRRKRPRTMKALTGKKRVLSRPADSLESLPNIGAVTGDKLRQIGITSKQEFLKRDPYEVFDELRKKVDPTLCRCALAGIVGAKKGVPWHKITKDSAREYEKKHPQHVWGKC